MQYIVFDAHTHIHRQQSKAPTADSFARDGAPGAVDEPGGQGLLGHSSSDEADLSRLVEKLQHK